MTMFYVAQFFGVLGILFSVFSMQMKKRRNIIIMLVLLNLASALNFLFLKFSGNINSYASVYICLFAVLETFINYCFERKNKKVPVYVITIYAIVNILLGLLSFNGVLDLIPIVCALLFCATILCKKESSIRKLMFCNQSLWLVFDLIAKAYMFSISNILTLISIIIATYKFDIKKKN